MIEYLGPLPEDVEAYKDYARQKARQIGAPEPLFLGYFEQESGWDPYAKNPKSTALGLGQHLKGNPWLRQAGYTDADRTDPYKSIDAIALEMQDKHQKTGSWEKAVRDTGEGTPSYLNLVLNAAKKMYGYLGPSEAQAAEGPSVEYLGPLEGPQVEYLGPLESPPPPEIGATSRTLAMFAEPGQAAAATPEPQAGTQSVMMSDRRYAELAQQYPPARQEELWAERRPAPTPAPGAEPQLDATTQTLAQFAEPAGEMVGEAINLPFIPLEWGVKKVGEGIRPLMVKAFPRAKPEEIDMALHGLEGVAVLGLAPAYARLLGKGVSLLAQVGKDNFRRYAPDAFFKYNAKTGLPMAKSPAEIQTELRSMTGAERAAMARKYPQFKEALDEMTTQLELGREVITPEAPGKAPSKPAAKPAYRTGPTAATAGRQPAWPSQWRLSRTWTEPLEPKEQKKFALAKVDEHLANLDKQDLGDYEVGTPDTVVIDIPGDGEYRVQNSRHALEFMKKAFGKYPVTEPKFQPVSGYPSTKPSGKRPKLGEGIEYVTDYIPRKAELQGREANGYADGFYTNGWAMIKMPKPRGTMDDSVSKRIPGFIERWENTKGKQAVIEGEYKHPMDDTPVVVFRAGEIRTVIDANITDAMFTQHRDAKAYLTNPEEPIIFRKGKDLVGVAMPMRGADFERFDTMKGEAAAPPQAPKVAGKSAAPDPWKVYKEAVRHHAGTAKASTKDLIKWATIDYTNRKAFIDDLDMLRYSPEGIELCPEVKRKVWDLIQKNPKLDPWPAEKAAPAKASGGGPRVYQDEKGWWRVEGTDVKTSSKEVAEKAAQRIKPKKTATGGGTQALRRPEPSPGANYTGFIEDVLDTSRVAEAATAKPAPITRESVLRPLMKVFGVPLYHGHFKMRKALGFFRRPVEEVRLRTRGDLEATAHEMAHLLDWRDPAIKKMYRKKDVRAEIKGVSYDVEKLSEGFAEFVRLWATQPEQAAAKCPIFLQRFEDYLKTSKYGPALTEARAKMHEWFNQDALTRVRSKVKFNEQINDFLTDAASEFRQAVLDDLHGIERAETGITGKINPMGPYVLARNTRGIPAVVESAVHYGAPKLTERGRIVMVDKDGNPNILLTPEGKAKDNPQYKPWGLKNILDPVKDDLENWGLYAYGRRAEKLLAQGREHLLTKAEIKGLLSLETPLFKQVFEDYQKFNKQVLDFAQNCGVIDPMKRPIWESNVYIPFYRVDKTITPRGRGGKGIMRPIKRLRGGTSNLADPVENIFRNLRMLISSAMVNRARVATVNVIANATGGARFLTKIPKDNKAVYIDKEQLRRLFKQLIIGADPITAQELEDFFNEGLDDFVRFWQFQQAPKGSDVIAVMRSGKPQFYQVADPILYRAFDALPRHFQRSLVRTIVSFPKRLAHATITTALGFFARNISRDQMMATVMSKVGYKPFVDGIKGMKSRLLKDPYYRDWLANAGGWGTFYSEQTDAYKALDAFYKKHGIARQLVIDTPMKLYEFLRQIGEVFEEATRLGEFRRQLEHGAGSVKAVFESREISTDFAMRGDSEALGWLYDTVPFLKAGVVSVDRVYRGFAHGEARDRLSVILRTAMIALASMGLYALNRGNPLYEQLEDWDRDTNWHFFIPKKEALEHFLTTGQLPDDKPENLYYHWRFPKPWEIGGIGSMAERALEGYINGQPGKAAEKSLRIIRELFRWNITPQVIAPLQDIYSNWLSFPGRPIETQSMRQLEPWARVAPFTSRTLRALGENVLRKIPKDYQVISPAQIQVLIRGYLNTWGAFGLQLADQIFFDDVPNLRADQYPVLYSFYRKEPAHHTRYVTEFYEMLRQATEARRTLHEMDKTFRKDFGDDLVNTPENRAYRQLTKANTRMQVFNREMKQIQYAPDLASVQQYAKELKRDRRYALKVQEIQRSADWQNLGRLKGRLIDMWIQERNALAREVVQDVKSQQGGK
jgi:hypothetical protein